ncbi:MAG: hypothetical protein K2H30_03900 [Clostridia bacterium]|nr:hypothetical protein [Clostridia bacterium]MDE7265752.1 hypothetical protein [Clostridia bacterium]
MENKHSGHRKRMYEKLSGGDKLFDHEILEMLLYGVYRQGNTNGIAHDLLNRFVSIKGVVTADPHELMTVDGVGESAAYFLATLGKCFESFSSVEWLASLKTREDAKKFIKMRFRGKPEEYLELYLLSRGGNVKRVVTFTSEDVNRVVLTAEKIVEIISLVKPYRIIAAHNHLNGSSQPSENDVNFTKELQMICSMNNVELVEHFIYAGDDNIYCFFDDKRFENIKQSYSMDNVIKWIEKSN